LTKVLGIFSEEILTLIAFTFECQAWITMADIKQNYFSKFFYKYVIFRSKIWQKLRIFPKWAIVIEAPGFWAPLDFQTHFQRSESGFHVKTGPFTFWTKRKLSFPIILVIGYLNDHCTCFVQTFS
jgi:hypothetical protein